MRMVKHLDDVVALHAFQVKGIIGSRGCIARKQIYGQVMIGNFTVTYDERMLDGIHHFAHIARPGIGQEQMLRFGREHGYRTTNLLGKTL